MKQLDEKLLASDFTFGFELEAYAGPSILKKIPLNKDLIYNDFIEDAINSTNMTYDEVNDTVNTYNDYIDFRSEYSYGDEFDELINDKVLYKNVEEALNIKKYFPEGAKWIKSPSKGFAYDGSLSVASFEWRSPVMLFTPESIAHCIAFLKNFQKTCYVNDDCGFHTHISFPGITEDDAKWIMIKLAEDSKMRKKLQSLTTLEDRNKEYSDMSREPISFYSHWADTDYLMDISDALHTDNIEGLHDLLSTEKYRALRIHPQGTLEWRSPRDFLDDGYSQEYIKSFFLSLYDFISWMRDALDSTSVRGYDRDNLLNLINSYGKGRDLFDKTSQNKMANLKRMFINMSKDKNVINKTEKLTIKQICLALVGMDKKERKALFANLISYVLDGKKLPTKLLACCIQCSESEFVKTLLHYINQPIPIKELEKAATFDGRPSIINVVRCFDDMSKEQILQCIHDTTSSFNELLSGFIMKAMDDHEVKGIPVWLQNAVYEKYGQKIDQERIKKQAYLG